VTAPTPPEPAVLAAFSLRDTPQHLKGGISQTVWRVGDVVLKPVQEANPGEAEWVATALDAIHEDGFRVAKPVRASSGAWMFNGWTAWRWFEGEPCVDQWPAVTEAARAFHRALPEAIVRAGLDPMPAWLEPRSHRWARAERAVWHGAPLPGEFGDRAEWSLYERAVALGPPLTRAEEAASQVVHGDIPSNVLIDRAANAMAFIDVSPGWRPPSSVDAQIATEAVAWFAGDPSLLDEVSAVTGGTAAMARVCAFRLLCGFQASANWADDYPGEVANWTRVLDLLGA
jgi:hypothetical protein